jgi:hypothetical protein
MFARNRSYGAGALRSPETVLMALVRLCSPETVLMALVRLCSPETVLMALVRYVRQKPFRLVSGTFLRAGVTPCTRNECWWIAHARCSCLGCER